MNRVPDARSALVSDALIDRLSAQHRQVEALITELSEAMTHHRLGRSRELLTAIRSALLGHLALEDLELYPALIVAAQRTGSKEDEQLARTSASHMESISRQLKEFFSRDSEQEVDAATQKRELTAMLTMLTMRIRSAETVLYPLYLKLCVIRRA